jgi:acetyl esterase/lipase
VSVDYTVSPEAKFPVALQQVLDVYLWITSDDPRVQDTFGFHPNHIIFCGDSAGGNLLTALTFALNDLRKGGHPQVLLPKALICLYTPFNLSLLLTPANILSCCDSMISTGIMLSCFEAYLPQVRGLRTEQTSSTAVSRFSLGWSGFKLFDDEYTAYFVSILDKVCGTLEGWGLTLSSSLTGDRKKKPWYLSQKCDLYAHLEEIENVSVNPYVSPLFYPDMESLSNTSLHLIALHFDPFLDDSVSMAKKWKGPVSMQVLDGLQHGFLNFMPFVGEAKRGSDICVQKLRESLQL